MRKEGGGGVTDELHHFQSQCFLDVRGDATQQANLVVVASFPLHLRAETRCVAGFSIPAERHLSLCVRVKYIKHSLFLARCVVQGTVTFGICVYESIFTGRHVSSSRMEGLGWAKGSNCLHTASHRYNSHLDYTKRCGRQARLWVKWRTVGFRRIWVVCIRYMDAGGCNYNVGRVKSLFLEAEHWWCISTPLLTAFRYIEWGLWRSTYKMAGVVVVVVRHARLGTSIIVAVVGVVGIEACDLNYP
jgi:hypothetical protein